MFIAEMQPLISVHTTLRETAAASLAAELVELPFVLNMAVLWKNER